LNREIKLVLVFALAFSALEGLIVVTYIGSNQGSHNVTQSTLTTILTQTSTTTSVDSTSTFDRETTSSTTTSTEIYLTPTSSAEHSSSTSQLKEAPPSTTSTSTVATVTGTSSTQYSTSSTFSSTTTSRSISTSSNTSTISTSTSSSIQSVTSATYTTTPQLTQMSLSCSPSEFQLGLSTKCTAAVTASAFTPTGQVQFVSNLPGSFTPGQCTLSGNSNLASCLVSFSPANTGIQQYYKITATYYGDAFHYGSSSSFTLIVALTGATLVTCYPNTVTINSTIYCAVMVVNTEDFATPTGTVTFSSNSSGAFNQLSCNLDSSASCSVYYTPQSKGLTIITAAYEGDNLHGPSSGTVQLTVT